MENESHSSYNYSQEENMFKSPAIENLDDSLQKSNQAVTGSPDIKKIKADGADLLKLKKNMSLI